jgi:hypothetical protein
VRWSQEAVQRIQSFYSDDPYSVTRKEEARFSFMKGTDLDERPPVNSEIIGE